MHCETDSSQDQLGKGDTIKVIFNLQFEGVTNLSLF